MLSEAYRYRFLTKKAIFEELIKEYPYPDGIVDFLEMNYPKHYYTLLNHWDVENFREYFTSEYRFFLMQGYVKPKAVRRAERKLEELSISLAPGSTNNLPVYYISPYEYIFLKDVAFGPSEEDLKLDMFPEEEYYRLVSKQEEQQGEEKMYFHFDTRTPLEQQQIDFAFSYARLAVTDAKNALRTKFNMDDDPRPETAEEFVERIKAGKYTILDKETDNRWRSEWCDAAVEYDLPRRLVWRTPDRVKDEDGYNAAIEVVDNEWTKLQTVIMAGDYKASIAAIDEFSKKYAA